MSTRGSLSMQPYEAIGDGVIVNDHDDDDEHQQHHYQQHEDDIDEITGVGTGTERGRSTVSRSKIIRVLPFVAVIVVLVTVLLVIVLHRVHNPHNAPHGCFPFPQPYPVTPIQWVPCPPTTQITADGKYASYAGYTPQANATILADCGVVEVPMDWPESSYAYSCGLSVHVFVKRLYGAHTIAPQTHLWLLGGGGGVPSQTLEPMAIDLITALPSISVYLMDKRGTGRSSLIQCTSFLSDFAGCMRDVEAANVTLQLQTNTMTNTARDILWLMRLTPPSSSNSTFRRMIMAFSQGTYIAQRLLVVEAAESSQRLVDGVVLSAALPMDVFRLIRGNGNTNAVAMDAFARCERDPVCASHFGTDIGVVSSVTNLWASSLIDDSYCMRQLNATAVQLANRFSVLLQTPLFPVMMGAVQRFTLCNISTPPHILDQLRLFWNITGAQVNPDESGDVVGESLIVEWTGDWSELWTTTSDTHADMTCDELYGYASGLYATMSPELTHYLCDARSEAIAAEFGVYAVDKYYNQYPQTTIPMLSMVGNMDSAIPIAWSRHARDIYRTYNSHNYTHIEFDHCAHTPTENTRLPDGNQCAWTIAAEFILSGGSTVDTSCVLETLPIDWPATQPNTQQLATQYFGTSSVWMV